MGVSEKRPFSGHFKTLHFLGKRRPVANLFLNESAHLDTSIAVGACILVFIPVI